MIGEDDEDDVGAGVDPPGPPVGNDDVLVDVCATSENATPIPH